MEEFELEPGEEIVETVRQHPFVLVTRLLPFFFLLFMPVILISGLNVLIHMSGATSAVPAISGGVVRFITGTYFLFLWIGAFTTFTRYYLTQWVITVSHPDRLRDVIMSQVAALHTTGDPMAMQTQGGV